MSTAMIIVIIVASVIVIGSVTICVLALLRRRELQGRFGAEYGRVVGASDNELKAEAGLKKRERRVGRFDIRPLTDAARAVYSDQWADIRDQFADAPADAVAASHVIVLAVINAQGYPAEGADQLLADLSVEHADLLNRYRSAAEISGRATLGTASTEDLRLAMIDYRAIFRDLLGAHGTSVSDVRSAS